MNCRAGEHQGSISSLQSNLDWNSLCLRALHSFNLKSRQPQNLNFKNKSLRFSYLYIHKTMQMRCNAIQTQTWFFLLSDFILYLWKHCQYCRPKSPLFLKLNHQVMKLVDWKGYKNKFWILTASTLISIYPSVRQYLSSIYPSVQIDFGHCPICLIKKVSK